MNSTSYNHSYEREPPTRNEDKTQQVFQKINLWKQKEVPLEKEDS